MVRFHLDLRHVPDPGSLQVMVHGSTYGLKPHSVNSLAAATRSDPVLSALPPEAARSFTHFVDVDERHFRQANVRWIRVVRPAAPGVHLPEVVAMAQVLPEGHLRSFFAARLERNSQSLRHLQALHRADMKRKPRVHLAKLARLGLQALPADRNTALSLLVNAQYLVTDLDTAAALLAYHPELASVQPSTATVVLYDHILPDPEMAPDQYNAMQALARAMTDPANQPWSAVVPCRDKDGNLLTAGYDLDDGTGEGLTSGQQLYTYQLNSAVLQASGAATTGACRSASDDYRLQNQLWAPTTGTAALVQSGSAPLVGKSTAKRRAAAAAPTYKWTVDEQTEHHGISVAKSSIRLDSSGHFSIDASNSYQRTIYAAYQLLDEQGKSLADRKLLWSMSAVNNLMGIPMPTDPTALTFDLGDAAAVKLFFGSLGTSDWDGDVSDYGALLTCLWQYGIPGVFLVAGKALTSTETFNEIVNDRDLCAAAIGIAFGLVGGGVVTAAAVFNTKKVLIGFASMALSIAVQKGMEKLGAWLTAQVAAGEIKEAFGPVGWAFSLAAAGMDFESLAITTGEVLSSPACVRVKVSRALDVAVTLHPDPRHGEAGDPSTAVWPSVASRYESTLQYMNGTSFQLKGQLPATTSNVLIPLLYRDVPAGGKFRIITALYSDSGWLAGSWQSDWLEAKPNQGTTLNLGDQSITENLVPLAPDTQYLFKERMVAKGAGYAWQAGGLPPSATLSALNCGGTGTLCELAGLTLNNSAFQVGYSWRASGQHLHPDTASAPLSDQQLYAVQNLSVLADPGSRLKHSPIGFTDRPAIAYAPSTNATNQIDQTNFILDPRGGGMNLRQVTLSDGQTDFGLDGNLQSWGSFPLENIDALAIHPSNAVVACSWKDHKLMLLQLPDAPKPDGQAPVALMVSGQGIRQGLMQGPKALAIAPDGRILVLESLNRRVQAFDIKGNPVPSFTPGGNVTTVPTADVGPALDAGQVPESLLTALQTARYGFRFTLDPGFIAQLNSCRFAPENDPLILALSQEGVVLAYDPERMDDPAVSAQIRLVEPGLSWIITDPRGTSWQVLTDSGALAVYWRPDHSTVRVEQAGQQWLLLDTVTGNALRLLPSTADPTVTEVRICQSFFPLRVSHTSSITYLDMAVEATGFVYVLAYQNDGTKPSDYLLDIYGPDGRFVLRTPDPNVISNPQNVVAGRITVDIWRNLYGLTFETLQGSSGGPQPGLAHWTPTPPLFTLPLDDQSAFNQLNIGVVTQLFAGYGIALSTRAFIVVDDPDGAWEVKDGTTIYHVYRSGDGLQVYAVPA
ncbi:MAG: hypothetical protein ACM3XM_01500 [Mycobacterium leprae]